MNNSNPELSNEAEEQELQTDELQEVSGGGATFGGARKPTPVNPARTAKNNFPGETFRDNFPGETFYRQKRLNSTSQESTMIGHIATMKTSRDIFMPKNQPSLELNRSWGSPLFWC